MLTYFKASILLVIMFFSFSSFGQSKKERKAELTGLSTGMYNSTKSTEALKYYELGVEAARVNDFKAAIKHYKKALKEDPKFVEAYDNIAVCYRRVGDFKNAIKNYNTSLELYPEGTMAHMNLGVIYGIQKDYDRALAEYEKVQELDPEDAEGYYGTINIYLNTGEYKKAIESATKTLEIYEANKSPYVHDAEYLLGLAYYYDNDKPKAKIYLRLAKKGGVAVPQDILDNLD